MFQLLSQTLLNIQQLVDRSGDEDRLSAHHPHINHLLQITAVSSLRAAARPTDGGRFKTCWMIQIIIICLFLLSVSLLFCLLVSASVWSKNSKGQTNKKKVMCYCSLQFGSG